MPLSTELRVVAAKLETTAGTAESLTNAEAKILAENPSIEDDTPYHKRSPAMSTGGSFKGKPGLAVGKFKAKLELKGKGASGLPLWSTTLLRCCGLDLSTATFTPTSDATKKKTCTIGMWDDGIYRRLKGVMLNAKLNFEMGQLASIDFDGQGIPVDPSDASMVVPTHETSDPVNVDAGIITLASYTPAFEKASFDLGNKIMIRDHLHAFITSREPMFTIDPEADLVATYDAAGIFRAATQFQTVITLNGGSNNTITITAPKVQWAKAPKLADRKGVKTWALEGHVNRDSDTGDADYTIVFS